MLFPVLLFALPLVIFGTSNIGVMESPGDLTDPPPDFGSGNWNNLMNPHGCVVLWPTELLQIKAVVTVGTPQLDLFTDIYIIYHFNGGPSSALIGPVTSNNLVTDTLSDGTVVYRYYYSAYQHQFSQECPNDSDEPINFPYNISLRDVNGNPYPIASNLDLLKVRNINNPQGPNTPIGSSISYNGVKQLCCHNAGMGLVQNSNGNTIAKSSNPTSDLNKNNNDSYAVEFADVDHFSPTAVPNPFSETLKIEFQSLSSQVTNIQLWDINGKLVYQFDYLSTEDGIQQVQIDTDLLNAGFFFCNIKNKVSTHTLKIFKLE